jgi:hypothetical protein
MVNSVVGDDSLCPFLTEGQEVVVSVMTRIGKYEGQLGDQAGYQHGKTLGILGEFDSAAGQMLTLLQLPDGTMVGALVPSIVTVPRVASVTAQYQVLALLGEGTAKLVDVQIGADNSDEMAIPRLQMIPTLWDPYFSRVADSRAGIESDAAVGGRIGD